MKPKNIWANLGVSDLNRTTNFYSALGFQPNGKNPVTNELTSFRIGEDGFVINFFLREIIENRMRVKLTDTKYTIEIMFTLSADSNEQVLKWANEVEKAGGKVITWPEEFVEGYFGFVFSDPDGHTFNVLRM